MNYEDLSTSTTTVMVYSNIDFNLKKIFHEFPVIKLPPTARKNNIPYGSIVLLRSDIYLRGERMCGKKKKYWCPICQLLTEKGKKKFTVEEEEHPLCEKDSLIYPQDTKKLWFKCSVCDRYHDIKVLRKIVTFLNQTTIVISLGKMLVTIMLFDDKCKISGTKSFNNAVETIMILWEDYIYPLKNTFSMQSIEAHFVFELVMKNIDFKSGFALDKYKLNDILNTEEYRDIVYLSQCESTSASHLNIKLYSNKPVNFSYDMLVYPENNEEPKFIQVTDKLYSVKNNKNKKSTTTLIVFSSGECIMTGRYDINMKLGYEFFMDICNNNKNEIIEQVEIPEQSLQNFRNMVKW
jgi:hypothetical protein